MNFSKINQQTEPLPAEAELSKELFCMNWRQGLHRLEFNDQTIGDNQVGPKAFFEGQLLVPNRNCHLSTHFDAAPGDFVGKQRLVDRFEQARPSLVWIGKARSRTVLAKAFSFTLDAEAMELETAVSGHFENSP